MTNWACGFYPDCSSVTEWPRLWPGDEPDQQTGPDPAGEEGQGAGVRAARRAGPPTAQGVCHAGGLAGLRRPPVSARGGPGPGPPSAG